MDCNTLAAFRRDLYACFLRAGDALMNTADALLTETNAQSLVQLSLSPYFERRWSSLYDGFDKAIIDREALGKLFVRYAPAPEEGQRLLLGVDASSIARAHSRTARDRSYVHASNLPQGCKPVSAGWQFSMLAVLPSVPSSWTYVLDNQRIPSQKTQGEVAAEQLEAMGAGLPAEAVLLGDGYYGSLAFLLLTKHIACDKLLRFAKNRVLYRPAPPKTGKRGAPRKDGAAFKCHDPQTQGTPDASWSGQDANSQPVEVACWNNLHFRQARHLVVTLLKVTRQGAAGTKRDPVVSWFLFMGQHLPPLWQVPALYARRYRLEHGFRVDKQDLLWERARLRTPEQFQHWTDIVASVRNPLCLCRHLAAHRYAWERASRPVTPQQVRRGLASILCKLGTPARACQVRGKSPGRPKGQIIEKAPRYKVVFKATETTRKGAKIV